jgi:adenylylsulfate kinase
MIYKEESIKRSLVKTIIYRVTVMSLDFFVIYFFTKKIKIALGFMIISNLYSSISYIIYERVWSKIRWGLK